MVLNFSQIDSRWFGIAWFMFLFFLLAMICLIRRVNEIIKLKSENAFLKEVNEDLRIIHKKNKSKKIKSHVIKMGVKKE